MGGLQDALLLIIGRRKQTNDNALASSQREMLVGMLLRLMDFDNFGSNWSDQYLTNKVERLFVCPARSLKW